MASNLNGLNFNQFVVDSFYRRFQFFHVSAVAYCSMELRSKNWKKEVNCRSFEGSKVICKLKNNFLVVLYDQVLRVVSRLINFLILLILWSYEMYSWFYLLLLLVVYGWHPFDAFFFTSILSPPCKK
ncbi:unnamed protein product [Camellia sinensis]